MKTTAQIERQALNWVDWAIHSVEPYIKAYKKKSDGKLRFFCQRWKNRPTRVFTTIEEARLHVPPGNPKFAHYGRVGIYT